jgi:hypothetical protein
MLGSLTYNDFTGDYSHNHHLLGLAAEKDNCIYHLLIAAAFYFIIISRFGNQP